jgi:hypothetical protein
MSTINTTDEGNYEFDFEFVLNGITYNVKGETSNTETIERDEQGGDQFKETLSDIELLEVMEGEDFDIVVTDKVLLLEIEKGLYNY